MVERAKHLALVRVIQEKPGALGQLVLGEEHVDGARAGRMDAQAPHPRPVRGGERDAGIAPVEIRHELIGEAVSVPEIAPLQGIEP